MGGSLQVVDLDEDSDDDDKIEAEDARALKKAKRGAARAAKRALRKIATRTRSDSDSDSSSESDEQLVAPVDGEGASGAAVAGLDRGSSSAARMKRGTCVVKSFSQTKSPKSPDSESQRSSNNDDDGTSPLLPG